MFKNDIQYLGFNDLWLIIVGIIVLGFLIPLIFFGVDISDNPGEYPSIWLEASIFVACYWMVNRFMIIKFRKVFPSWQMTSKRLILVIISTFFLISLTGMIIKPIIIGFLRVLGLECHEPTPLQGIAATYTATFFMMAVYESIWYYSQLKKSIQEKEQVKIAHVQTQLDGLRNQVNPHFLFNSLNTLNHIVEYEDKAVAKNFINQLSKVYRYILDSREESTINLEAELDFVEAYIAIQKERFLENLNVKIEIPPRFFNKKIIPLSLQLLIENAIKHNVISTKKPLHICIRTSEDGSYIYVENNLQKKSKVLHSTKVGLDNIKERYRLLSEEQKVEVKETEAQFAVSIPLLQ